MKTKFNALTENQKVLFILGSFFLMFLFAVLFNEESESVFNTVSAFLMLGFLILGVVLISWKHEYKKLQEKLELEQRQQEKIKKQQAIAAAKEKKLSEYIEKNPIDYHESLVIVVPGVDIDDKFDEIDVLIVRDGEIVVDEYLYFEKIDEAAYFWDTIDKHVSDNSVLITFKAGDELTLLSPLKKKADKFPKKYFSILYNINEYLPDINANSYNDLLSKFNIPEEFKVKIVYYEMLKELVSRGIDIDQNKRNIK